MQPLNYEWSNKKEQSVFMNIFIESNNRLYAIILPQFSFHQKIKDTPYMYKKVWAMSEHIRWDYVECCEKLCIFGVSKREDRLIFIINYSNGFENITPSIYNKTRLYFVSKK